MAKRIWRKWSSTGGAGLLALTWAVTAFSATRPVQRNGRLTPELDPATQQSLRRLLDEEKSGRNLASDEMTYQSLVQPQTFADLLLLYAPENAKKVQLTYPSFTPDGMYDAGGDLGYGLHVVRRLRLALGGGREKVIEVNEQWPENQADGGLYLPDEIRVKTLAFEGPRFVPGSERLYLFDSFRIAWDSESRPHLARRTRFAHDPRSGSNRLVSMRVPVSAPFSCVSCHTAGTSRARKFLGPGERRNPEAIVQDGYYSRPLSETDGFKGYLAQLAAEKRAPAFIAAARRALLDPERSLALPGLRDALRATLTNREFVWLGGDSQMEDYGNVSLRRGVYAVKDRETGAPVYYEDAVEDLLEGAYRWWFPSSVLPSTGPVSAQTY